MSTPQAIRHQFKFGEQNVILETGRIARQATGAVLCTLGETMVLATVVAAREASPNQGFFPLSVHYQEKFYAIGKIPGGFLKREGRPSEKETLTSRLIDRPIRPLFPKGFMNEVQVICSVLSASVNEDSDICALLATSAALSISGIPFDGPIGAARVGFNDTDGYILNPSVEQMKTSFLDMVVAGTADAVLMVESEAKELTEDQMLGGVIFAHEEFKPVVQAIKDFAAQVSKEQWDFVPAAVNEELYEQVVAGYGQRIADAYQVSDKLQRQDILALLKSQAVEQFAGEEFEVSAEDVKKIFASLEKKTVRQAIIAGQPRIDGRDTRTVRPLTIELDVLPKTHGSALFTRGETQALVTCTLGSMRDSQMSDNLLGTTTDPFMFQYNFPSFSVGECGRVGAISRREIGHGRLARRGIQAMMPADADFPYSIRVVAEITESNGSSSMASVCGSSLAMMAAGVPIKAPVAGIAMGLIKEDNGFAVITDILGDEDHLGDMDFKVAGSETGITALQMDIKIKGITEEIMEIALEQAMEARLHILKQMNDVIRSGRTELPDTAPSMEQIHIDTDKIREVIGKGGATIRGICDATGANIDIDDDGRVRIYAPNKTALQAAMDMVMGIVAEPEIGQIYLGTVVKLADFGAFVNFLGGKDGLVHISQIAEHRVENVADELTVGQKVPVKVLDVDNRGRIKLSIKELTADERASVQPAE